MTALAMVHNLPTAKQPAFRAGGLVFRPVDAATHSDFERLFGTPGAPGHCWCMVWRRTPEEAKRHGAADRRSQMMERLDSGVPVGLIGYAADVPSAWVSIAPRDTYRNLGGPPAGEGETIWSLVCFFVPRKARGQGTVRSLIAAAVEYARQGGATMVEAYPVDETAPSYRFMGFVPVFAAAGFKEIGRAGTRRHVMRLDLRPPSE
jgi:GNAT superfamily N-acetyltransferase